MAQDYLKVIWSATEWGDPPITSTALANRFGTSVANVTDTVKRLAQLGLVTHKPYKPIYLTPIGTRYAVAMVRRHRLLETFLVDKLGYGWDEVHNEAERLEHAATSTLIDRIDAALGHPVSDPHGDPIPDRNGVTHKPTNAVRLSEAGAGSWTVIRVSDADPDVLARAERLGLSPRRRADINENIKSDRELGAAIWVVPYDSD
ncbi:metal-dependent transcriptional regulator [Microlunatus elymi]|uniref:metal-dependent transcriptional regulator n=1 Tax=Microlunatus elymi TaxID=2596828 RepID=UPI001AEFCB31|nr:metal-dependent transcriptional regulator [Microlunatus elymi]